MADGRRHAGSVRRPAVADMSDAWLIGRARELGATVQTAPPEEQRDIIADIDVLLAEARRRGDAEMIAELLRTAATSRLCTSELREAEPFLDEMLEHCRSAGLTVPRAAAYASRAHRLILSGNEDAALDDVARALAILDDAPRASSPAAKRTHDRWLSHALTDTRQRLVELGLFETAEEVYTHTQRVLADGFTPHDVTLQLLNLIELLLGWAIWLERVDRVEQARQKFHTAASVAHAVEAPFAESLFRVGNSLAIDQIGLVAAAPALHRPTGAQVARLRRLFAKRFMGQEKAYVGIALARCLEAEGRHAEGKDVLIATQAAAEQERAPTTTALSLSWELARLTTDKPSAAAQAHARALENELWQMREARAVTLQTRRQHVRLTAEHGAIVKQAEQALQDPLTGLANRRALDERLREMAASAATTPVSVALIDLDGFKRVNDLKSHAEGDDVLRVIASTLRDALRGDDFVARYGGDEFVALLPGAPASAATMAMRRTVAAVADLPRHLSHGVTLSIGLVTMAPGEHPESVLSRADTAMYEAKRGGGNGVTAATPTADATS